MARSIPEESHSLRHFGRSELASFQSGEIYCALSWNIFKGKKRHWTEDFNRLHPVYDLLLLQEAKINFNESIDHYDPAYSWLFGESFALDRCGSSCGVLTGSRIHQLKAFNRHGPVREPFLKTPKSTAFAYYGITDRPECLLVINTHFINFRQSSAFERQLEQVAEVMQHHAGPILFAGDFNTWNGRRRQLLEHQMLDCGLEKVTIANEKRSLLILDHIFTRQLRIHDAKQLDFIQSSDHLPLSLWFEIPATT